MATYLLIAFAVMVLHEVGHLATARALGIRVKRVGISWKGMYVVRETGPTAANLITTLAGPLFNLSLAVAWPLSHEFAWVNVAFAIGNLLPIEGSDGQRALALVTKGTFHPSRLAR
jgi:stage IV sporulation protein FB